MRKHNYLNNKDILSEIHKSKSSFCSYVEDSYNQFDLIIPLQGPHGTLEQGLAKINRNTIAEAKRNKAMQLCQQLNQDLLLHYARFMEHFCKSHQKIIKKAFPSEQFMLEKTVVGLR